MSGTWWRRHGFGFTGVVVGTVAVLVVPVALATDANSAPQPARVLSSSLSAQLAAIQAEKASRTPAQQKIDSHLLYAEKKAEHALPAGFPQVRQDVPVSPRGSVVVDVSGAMTTRLLSRVRTVGGEVTQQVPGAGTLRIRVPLTKLDDLARSPDVTSIAPPATPALATGSVDSEGDVTHRADTARSTFGVNGSGVKVGVLSDGVSSLSAAQSTGDLGPVTVLPGQAGPAGGDEGTAMLEIVHDIAPGAKLYFATAFNSESSFANNIRALRNAGCDVIVDDVYYYDEGVFQDGPVARAVNAVTSDGALYFSSAGNSGNLDDGTSGEWQGDFTPYTAQNGDVWADFDPTGGIQNADPVAASYGAHPAVLQWADRLNGSSNDYDLYLFSADGSSIIGYSTNTQSGSQSPFELVGVPAGGGLLAIQNYQGQAAPRFMSLTLNRGTFGSRGGFTAYATAGQTSGHSAAASAFSVAATPAHDAFGPGEPTGPFPGVFSTADVSETFTSDGPRKMYYAANGSAYTPGNFTSTGGIVRQKPDITAADGVATSVPGFQPFFGTSAAAPHAGAIAALMLQAHPGLSPAQVRKVFAPTAIDIEEPGWDRDTGVGIVDAYAAVQKVIGSGTHVSNLSIDAPAAVQYGASATVSAKLTDAQTHAALGGQQVALYRRASLGKPWGLVGRTNTSASGVAKAALRLTANTQFRWRFGGTAGHAATTSPTESVAVTQVVSVAQTAKSISRGQTVRFYGTVRPAGAGQQVYLQQLSAGKWVSKGSAVIHRQQLPDGRRVVGYVLPIKLRARGTLTFRVLKPATPTLAAGHSAARKVKVS
ncbi:MAG TPA: S8 family serine peptidase [Jatrophihabitans sp.]|nr:S8 family serine peptidase [Jatrophihabitans sp.]